MFVRFLYTVWCGAIVLFMLEVVRRPECRIKQYSVPHTFLILTAYLWGLVSINIMIMTKMYYDGKGPQLSEFFIFFIVIVIIGIVAWLFS